MMSRSCLDPDLSKPKRHYAAKIFLRQLNVNWELGDIKEIYYCNLVRCDQEFDM